ncbi:reticulon-3-B isoform X2 [Hydra vulgaris]|uniref:Reticulon-like protein n=1 Tax=Hydra vulgaris TaxID=6087 RepID=A0ABM4CHW7_HYDVU
MGDIQDNFISPTPNNNSVDKETSELQSDIIQDDDVSILKTTPISPKEQYEISSDDVSSTSNGQESLSDSLIDHLPKAPCTETLIKSKDHETQHEFLDKSKSYDNALETEKPKHKELCLKSPLGLWINENINVSIIRLIYWCDIQRSMLTFAGVLFLLLSLYYYPVIQVVSVFGLSLLIVAFLYRIGMTVVNAVQKTSTEHPFKNLLEEKIEISEQSVAKWSSILCSYGNKTIKTCQHLFLINDIFDSLKFGLFLWLVSYIGSCLSVLTLMIIVFILLFTVPKFYEEKQNEVETFYQVIIDRVLQVLLRIESKIPEKVKALFLKEKKD